MDKKHPSSKRYPPELKERAVRMVLDLQHQDPGDHGVIGRVAFGISDGWARFIPSMELDSAVAFARTNRQAVLTTIRANGRPQQSNILYHVFDDGVIRISVTVDRAKFRNLSHDPWAALHVTREDFFAYVVLEGNVELTPVATRSDDAVVEELIEIYRALMGEHENWNAYRDAMVAERRAVIRFTPNRAYGML
jgi:PPOX class probable F420-dependent enzyme